MRPAESAVPLCRPLPDVAVLRPRQQMAIECALCARPLGTSGRVLGEVRHRGLPFRLWACATGCPAAEPAFTTSLDRPM